MTTIAGMSMAKRTLCDAYKTACIDYLHSSASLYKFIVWMNNYPEGNSIGFETELLSV